MLQKKRFSNILQETAQEAQPAPVAYRAMLNNIMPEAVAEGRVSYADACAQVEALGRVKARRTWGGLTFLSLSMAAAMAMLLVMPGLIKDSSTSAVGVSVGQTVPAAGLLSIMEENVPLSTAPDLPAEEDHNLATAIPTMEGYTVEDDLLYIRFACAASAVDWPALYALDQNGELVAPYQILPQEGLAVFVLPESDIEIFVASVDGALGQCTLSVK